MSNKKRILDIMLDEETLGNSERAIITQLAAVAFRLEDGVPLDDPFNKLISPQSCVAAGLTSRPSNKDIQPTLDWWLTQDKEVFNTVILKAFTHGEDLTLVLKAFSAWLKEMMKTHKCEEIRIWGNGPAADCVWLRSAYNACNLKVPWSYWDDACVRTMVDLGVRALNMNPKKEMPFFGNKHNAIDDCNHQIKYVCAIYKEVSNQTKKLSDLEKENQELKLKLSKQSA